ncbi:hypothetical protein U9M48_033410 [Paspalum notatum var. saurae]|uniref:Uncharacterized protein n=1 Tax=Paspalum notatum var. saurae TaxID=547442 RepID=A0AAQ3UAM1_PASNO
MESWHETRCAVLSSVHFSRLTPNLFRLSPLTHPLSHTAEAPSRSPTAAAMSSAAALLLRPTSATTHPFLHLPSPKSRFLRLHPSRRRLPVPRLSLTPTANSGNNSPPPAVPSCP